MSDNSTFYAVLAGNRAAEAAEWQAAAEGWARSYIEMYIFRDILLAEIERLSGKSWFDRLDTFERRVEHYRSMNEKVDKYAKSLGIVCYQRQPSRSPEAVAVDRMQAAGLEVTPEQKKAARKTERRHQVKGRRVQIWIDRLVVLAIIAGASYVFLAVKYPHQPQVAAATSWLSGQFHALINWISTRPYK
ncbi:hypothetical protein BI364_10410 [Acidihalobacter yilgarnensis]|uniref:Uncharacterized protein n=1 Tax=Acidihalobacter yilgarnensis TaxID=2819280 RepID=A0A1D8IPF4_9GAMM|nr:hypothetical protein [Acidihalobacter yilgarnensis]AOU98319.1 hypothetical protein BI364_10410 [Acidihalobacter yilgarnensis]